MKPHKIMRVTGGRVAWTNTSRIPDAKVREVIRFVAREVHLDGTVIHVKKCGRRRASAGRMYRGIPSIANMDGLRRGEWSFLIVVTDDGSFLDFVDTMAHEAKHVEQHRERRLQRREANARNFAYHVSEKWLACRSH